MDGPNRCEKACARLRKPLLRLQASPAGIANIVHKVITVSWHTVLEVFLLGFLSHCTDAARYREKTQSTFSDRWFCVQHNLRLVYDHLLHIAQEKFGLVEELYSLSEERPRLSLCTARTSMAALMRPAQCHSYTGLGGHFSPTSSTARLPHNCRVLKALVISKGGSCLLWRDVTSW